MIHIIDLEFQKVKKAIGAFLVETRNGLALIETGPYSTYPMLKKAIEDKGFNVEDIKHVFLTHIHLDHAGAAWKFAEMGARVYVHPVGYKHLLDPSKLMDSAKRIYQDAMESLWGEMKAIPEKQMKSIDHGTTIKVGDTTFKAWHTPGHATHHIAWQVGKALFAGDVAGVKIEKGIVMPPCPPPDINIEDWQRSIRLIKSIDLEVMYLTHFGKVVNITRHLNELEKCLLDWANWIKPYWEEDASVAEVVPVFQKYVADTLTAAGIDKDGLLRYEMANPSWMSVTGLMRYWKKKVGKVKT